MGIVDDGTADEETKLGAIGDLELSIREVPIDDDLIVVAGDNFFSERPAPSASLRAQKNAPVLASTTSATSKRSGATMRSCSTWTKG